MSLEGKIAPLHRLQVRSLCIDNVSLFFRVFSYFLLNMLPLCSNYSFFGTAKVFRPITFSMDLLELLPEIFHSIVKTFVASIPDSRQHSCDIKALQLVNHDNSFKISHS